MTEPKKDCCRKCGVELIENDNWSPALASAKNRICKSCNSERAKEWQKQNPDKYREYLLKKTYGIDDAEWNRMFEAQGGRCAICGSPDPGGKDGVFHVDHCHSTSKVRGLLCNPCNRALGLFRDNKNILKSAIEYLEVHE